jgi:simple sugar transport system ATP-binding protein
VAKPAIRIGARGVTRRFAGVVANDAIDLAAPPGTILGVVGGNGAGKTTLMRILQGLEQPDEGSVIVNDEPVRLADPADAFARGIGMVHQEFMLVQDLTLLENLTLGREIVGRGGVIDRRAAMAEARRLSAIAGITLDWTLLAGQAPVHLRQIVEILRLLYRGADVLILDEPTAVLAPKQVRDLLALLRRLRDEGRTILFISHKLDEVLAVCDRVTVLRRGRVVATTTPAEADIGRLAELMVGEPVEFPHRVPQLRRNEAPVLSLRGLSAVDARGVTRLDGVDLDLRPGEIVGVAGVSGSGQDEMVAAIVGLRQPLAGRVLLLGYDATASSIYARREAGLGYISADRAHEGLCLPETIESNVIAGRHRAPPFARAGLLRPPTIRTHVEAVLRRFGVVYGGATNPVRSLSGGNQQRVVIARELDRNPKALIAAQPTRGVDIAGIAYIHRSLLAFSEAGGAILLISEELDELLALSDRIVVLHRGGIAGELSGEKRTIAGIGRLMLGEAA